VKFEIHYFLVANRDRYLKHDVEQVGLH
jgi:hypothetical protein